MSAQATIGYIGLGKMGQNMVLRLLEKGWNIVASDTDESARQRAERSGIKTVDTLEELVLALEKPRIVWIMVPARGKPAYSPVDDVIGKLLPKLEKGDILLDGGNSFYEDSRARAQKLQRKGIYFLDVGVSGGPGGARNGACVMVGGKKAAYHALAGFFRDIAIPDGFMYAGLSGAGHFVKMVHNGIEYGMMQAIAEGFALLKESPFRLSLRDVAKLYNHGSVVESRLVGWLGKAFEVYGENLQKVSGEVAHTGEGEWTVRTAKKLGIEAPIIKEAFEFRRRSQHKPTYTGKILTALRNQFGGHRIKKS